MNSFPANNDFPYSIYSNMHMFDEFERVIFQRDLSFNERREELDDQNIKWHQTEIKQATMNQASNFSQSAPNTSFE